MGGPLIHSSEILIITRRNEENLLVIVGRNNGIGEWFGEGGSIQLICLEPVAG